MITQTYEKIREKIPSARLEEDHSITIPECIVCAADNHPNKSLKVFVDTDGKITGISCSRFASAGCEANREHCMPIREMLGLGAESEVAFISIAICDGDFFLDVEDAGRGQVIVTLRDKDRRTINRDTLNLNRGSARAAFVASTPKLNKRQQQKLHQALLEMSERFERVREAVNDDHDSDSRKRALDELLQRAKSLPVQFFHDSTTETAYISLEIDGHQECHPLHSRQFRRLLSLQWYRTTGTAPREQVLSDVLLCLEAECFLGADQRVYRRVAECEGRIYLDLCNAKWQAVEVSEFGWRVVDIPPVNFIRKAGMLPLPEPARGGSWDDIRPLLNLDDEDFQLGGAWSLGTLFLNIGVPPLAITGPPDAAKTCAATLFHYLTDPNEATALTEPREPRDLAVAVRSAHIVFFDNLASIPQWLSDMACRMATGGSYLVRSLYTDDDTQIFKLRNPLILTSVTDVIVKSDLASRALNIEAQQIPVGERIPESEIMVRFRELHPRVLGALLGAATTALRDRFSVDHSNLPRMADFCKIAIAAEHHFGFEKNGFLKAYTRSLTTGDEKALDSSSVADAVIRFMSNRKRWEGAATTLLRELEAMLRDCGDSPRQIPGWPRAPHRLTGELRQLTANLARVGIVVKTSRTKKARGIEIIRQREDSKKKRHQRHPEHNSSEKAGLKGDASSQDERHQASPKPPAIVTDGACEASSVTLSTEASDTSYLIDNEGIVRIGDAGDASIESSFPQNFVTKHPETGATVYEGEV